MGESDAQTNAVMHDVIAEVVCNAFRHGNAREVHVDVATVRDGVRIFVDDDGTSHEGAAARHRRGLTSRSP